LIPDISIKPEAPVHSFPRPSSFTIPITIRSDLPSENVNKPTLSSPSQSPSLLPTIPTSPSVIKTAYKPSVSFQSAPLSFSTDTHQSSTTKRTVPSPSNTETHVGRPETLIFQHDEDIRSSPLITPLLESPITRIEAKTEPEPASSEDVSTASSSSKPIEIFEKTINKYDAIIDQISSILASVSPLSSTVSSMSPGKSVLDYELTIDGSPILQRKCIEPESSQQSTATHTNTPRVKGKYLIRDDSYDKIITAIADLDNEWTPSPENQDPTTTVIEEEKEDQQRSLSSEQLNDETKTLSFDEHQIPLDIAEKKGEIEISSTDEQQLSPITESEKSEHPIASISSLNDMNLDVQSTMKIVPNRTELIQQQTDLLSYPINFETNEEQTRQSNDEVSPNMKNRKRVTWGDIIVNSDDSESSLSQSWSEETSSSETSITIDKNERLASNKSSTIIEQQINSPTFIGNVGVDDQANAITPIELSNLNDQEIISTESTQLSTMIIARHIKCPSSPETSSSTSDSIERQTTSSDLNESQSSQDEQIISSENSAETQFVSTIDSSNQDTLAVDETRKPPIKDTDLLSLPIVESPIDTLIDSISTRYISSDVYHGYLGDHKQFIDVSEIFKFFS
jgi:hypothetical protein